MMTTQFKPGLDFKQGNELVEQLQALEVDLAERQDELAEATRRHFLAKRDREQRRARAFMAAGGTVAERNAQADLAVSVVGVEAEATYEASRAVNRVIETRASILQTLLRSGVA